MVYVFERSHEVDQKLQQRRKIHTDAFVHIVRRYQRMVFTIVSKIVSRKVEAEDITQEVFIKAFQFLDKFREESEFATWLYRIAYNTTISELRKRKHEFTAIEDNFANVPDAEIADTIDEISVEDKLQYLDIVLKKLPPDDALLIDLSQKEGGCDKMIVLRGILQVLN